MTSFANKFYVNGRVNHSTPLAWCNALIIQYGLLSYRVSVPAYDNPNFVNEFSVNLQTLRLDGSSVPFDTIGESIEKKGSYSYFRFHSPEKPSFYFEFVVLCKGNIVL